jgi:hypothetical protein|tara:strand:+ start:211 stop:786 length:576 start_codon:yes stop_codon:yes gene_type:complete
MTIYSFYLTLVIPLLITPLFSQQSELHSAYNIPFGSSEELVIQKMAKTFQVEPSITYNRDNYNVLEFYNVKDDYGKINKLRFFVSEPTGVFRIESEFFLRWYLQIPDADNLENHQHFIETVLYNLRKQYGTESIYEPPNITRKFELNDYVTATWQFKNNRWLHLIYETQDWTIWPELSKIIIIYRDSNFSP